MTYHHPYLPHELDEHPDQGRIQATIDLATTTAVTDAVQEKVNKDAAIQEVVRGALALEAKVAKLKVDLENALARGTRYKNALDGCRKGAG